MSDEREQAQRYQQLVLRYEAVGQQIQDLITRYGGHTETIPPADMQLYRQLASTRDALYNEIKALEEEWLGDG